MTAFLIGATAVPRAHAGSSASTPIQSNVSSNIVEFAEWVRATSDNQGRAFIVVDKINATLYVFDADAKLSHQTPVLLGAARGDRSPPGVGSKKLSHIRPEERTTAAGRFIGQRGRNLTGEDIVWIDYHAALAIHRVRSVSPGGMRAERLASASALDKRVSYGCVNVPVRFFETVIAPMFRQGKAMIYVLPEELTMAELFGFQEGKGST
jgi:hypothetical protein